MKKCPFCAEEIQDEAIKCKHCSEFLDESKRPFSHIPPPVPAEKINPVPWYFRTATIVIVLLSIPPLALPLVIWHPKMSLQWKIINSVAILLISWGAWVATVKSLEAFEKAMETIQEMQM